MEDEGRGRRPNNGSSSRKREEGGAAGRMAQHRKARDTTRNKVARAEKRSGSSLMFVRVDWE